MQGLAASRSEEVRPRPEQTRPGTSLGPRAARRISRRSVGRSWLGCASFSGRSSDDSAGGRANARSDSTKPTRDVALEWIVLEVRPCLFERAPHRRTRHQPVEVCAQQRAVFRKRLQRQRVEQGERCAVARRMHPQHQAKLPAVFFASEAVVSVTRARLSHPQRRSRSEGALALGLHECRKASQARVVASLSGHAGRVGAWMRSLEVRDYDRARHHDATLVTHHGNCIGSHSESSSRRRARDRLRVFEGRAVLVERDRTSSSTRPRVVIES